MNVIPCYVKRHHRYQDSFGIKYSRKHLLVYETSETATESPVYKHKNATIGQAYYRTLIHDLPRSHPWFAICHTAGRTCLR